MKALLIAALCIAVSAPVIAKGNSNKPMTYSASRSGKAIQNYQASQALGNTYDMKCTYSCPPDLSTGYSPSAKKYARRVQ